MKKIALTILAVSTLGLAACGDNKATNNTSNVAEALENAGDDLENAAAATEEAAGNVADAAGNVVDAAGDTAANATANVAE